MNTAEKSMYTTMVNNSQQLLNQLFENIDDLFDFIDRVESPTDRDRRIRDLVQDMNRLGSVMENLANAL